MVLLKYTCLVSVDEIYSASQTAGIASEATAVADEREGAVAGFCYTAVRCCACHCKPGAMLMEECSCISSVSVIRVAAAAAAGMPLIASHQNQRYGAILDPPHQPAIV